MPDSSAVRVPEEWLDGLTPEVRPLMEEFLLGLAALPETIVRRAQKAMDAPDSGDLDIVRILFEHDAKHGGDARALLAAMKMVERAREAREAYEA